MSSRKVNTADGYTTETVPSTEVPTGPTGPAGSQIYSDAGAPAGGLGVDDDFYLNETNGDFYLKVASAWVLQGNLTGPQGIQGIQGPVADYRTYALGDDLTAGDAVSMYDDGGTPKVQKLTPDKWDGQDPQDFKAFSNGTDYIENGSVDYDTSISKYIVGYIEDVSATKKVYCMVGEQSGRTVTYGTAAEAVLGSGYNDIKIKSMNDGKFVLMAWNDSGSIYKIKAVIGSISGTTVTYGTVVDLSTNNFGGITNSVPDMDFNNGKGVYCYQDDIDNQRTGAFTVSGTTITIGTEVNTVTGSGSLGVHNVIRLNKDGTSFICFTKSSGGAQAMYGATISGTVITMGSGTAGGVTLLENYSSLAGDKWLATESVDGYKAGVISLSGTTVTVGSFIDVNDDAGNEEYVGMADDTINNKMILFTYDGYPGTENVKTTIITVDSDDDITFTTTIETDYGTGVGKTKTFFGSVFNPDNENIAICQESYNDEPSGYISGSLLVGKILKPEGFVGIAQETGVAGNTKKIALIGETSEQNTGGTGLRAYLQYDGTVSDTVTPYEIGIFLGDDEVIIRGLI